MKLKCDREEYKKSNDKSNWLIITVLFVMLFIGFLTRQFIDPKLRYFKNQNMATKSIITRKIIQKTCSGKMIGMYNNCTNIRNENGIVSFSLTDPNRPADIISIQGGIIIVETKINKKQELSTENK
jgi:ribosomal protein L27